MKNLTKTINLFVIVIIAIASTSCEKSLIGIKGDGATITQELLFEEISGFDMDISSNVYIEQGDTQKVIVKAQQNIINNLKTEVNNNILVIDFDKNVRSHDGVNFYITVPTLTRAQINGSGNIETTNTFTQNENIELGISGSGNIKAAIKADEVYSKLTGSGTISIETDCNFLSTRITGSGNYILSGTATEAEHAIDGSGDIKAFNLTTVNTSIDNSGSSKGQLSVSKQLDVNISGSGNIYYKGTPQINVSISGSGKLIQSN